MSFFRRMGSASSSVRSVSIDQASEDRESSTSGSARRLTSGKDKELKRLNEQVVNLEVLLDQVKRENGDHKSNLQSLTTKLEAAEGEIERLVEQNRVVEERLEMIEDEPESGAAYDISESLKLKEQEISKLRIEVQSSQNQAKSLKQKYKTRLQSIRADHSKSKQEQSLKTFELKDEISILAQENDRLLGKLESLGASEESDGGAVTAEANARVSDGRSTIIIELSTQISDQEYRISTLESQLEEKDLLIAKLKSGKTSPRDAHSLITLEAQKASEEMHSIAEELKRLKRKKKKSRSEKQRSVGVDDFSRDLSSLSFDSGAVDLSSPKRLDSSHRQTSENVDQYGFYTPSHSELSFNSSSTLVT